MENRRQTKSFLKEDVHTAEFTSGQLILGICGLLVVAMGCFAMGIMLERWQETRRDRVARSDGTGLPEAARSVEAAAVAQGGKTRDAVSTLKAPPAKVEKTAKLPQMGRSSRAKPAGESGAPSKPPAGETGSGVTTKPVPKKEQPAQKGESVARRIEKSGAAKGGQTKTAKVAPAIDKDKKEPSGRVRSTVKTESRTTEAKISAPPKVAKVTKTPVIEKGPRYTVQVAAFLNPNNATGSKKRLEANSRLKVELVKSASGRWTYLWIGDYGDRASATKGRDELRKIAGFKDCIVKKRN